MVSENNFSVLFENISRQNPEIWNDDYFMNTFVEQTIKHLYTAKYLELYYYYSENLKLINCCLVQFEQ